MTEDTEAAVEWMPERIWARVMNIWFPTPPFPPFPNQKPEIEYVRADIHATLTAKVAILEAERSTFKDQVREAANATIDGMARENASLEAECARKDAALMKAREQFSEYALSHLNKTPPDRNKAARYASMAREIDLVLRQGEDARAALTETAKSGKG